MKNLYFDEWGHLTQKGIKLYADAMKNNELEKLPPKLYGYVQSHPECLSLILEEFDEFKKTNFTQPLNLFSSEEELMELQAFSLIPKTKGSEVEFDGNRAPADEIRKWVCMMIPGFEQAHPLRLERMREATLLRNSRKLNIKHPIQDEIFFSYLRIELGVACKEEVLVDIYSSKDEIVVSDTIAPEQTVALLDLEELNLESGIYYARLGHDTSFVTERFYYLTEEDQGRFLDSQSFFIRE